MKMHHCVMAGIFVLAAGGQAMALGPTNCRDPWIAQAYYQLYRRMPMANSSTTEECDITHYNKGHWNTYGDLVRYIRALAGTGGVYTGNAGYGAPNGNIDLGVRSQDFVATVSARQFAGLPQRDSNGFKEVYLNGNWYVIAAGGGNTIAAGGGNTIAQGGGNLASSTGARLVSTNGGNVIAAGGGNVVGQGGASVIAAGGGNVIAAGGGNVTLYKAKY